MRLVLTRDLPQTRVDANTGVNVLTVEHMPLPPRLGHLRVRVRIPNHRDTLTHIRTMTEPLRIITAHPDTIDHTPIRTHRRGQIHQITRL